MVSSRLVSSMIVLGAAISACSTTTREPDQVAQAASKYPVQEDVFFPGVNETVTVYRKAQAGVPQAARRPNQPLQYYPNFLLEERAALRARFGAIDGALAKRLVGAAPSETFRIAVFFDPGADGAKLGSRSELTRQQGRAELRANIASRGALLRAWAETTGMQVRRSGRLLPVILGTAPASVVRAIASDPRVTSVRLDEAGRRERFSTPYSLQGPASTHAYLHTDEFVSQNYAYYGIGQKVGIVESANCKMRDDHEAFAFTSVQYAVPADTCSSDGDCKVCNGGADPMDPNGACIAGRCVDVHATQVASAISASNDGVGGGAFRAQLYMANIGDQAGFPGIDYPTVTCNYDTMDRAYDWLFQSGVTTVNESWGCEDSSLDGVVQDYMSRMYGITVVKAAGNKQVGTLPACPESLNTLCVGATNSNNVVATLSRYLNPNGRAPQPPEIRDREEPDLMALGGVDGSGVEASDVAYVSDASTTLWERAAGTSIAAPAVAAQVALLKDACGGAAQGASLPPHAVRAAMKAAAYAANPDNGTPYSTPAQGVDYQDGAGVAWGRQILDFCELPGTNNTAKLQSGTVVPGAAPLLPEGGTLPTPKDPPGGFRGETVWRATLQQNETIRAVFSWDACTPHGDPSFVGIDFDLFLVNAETHQVVAASTSYNDNSEGFQVVVPAAGDYELFYTFPAGSTACIGIAEPYTLAVVYGSNFGP